MYGVTVVLVSMHFLNYMQQLLHGHVIDDESFPCITLGLAIATSIHLIIRVTVELVVKV